VPLNDANRNLIGPREIGLMRPGAFLVNCARGGLVDEQALNLALEERRLAGAGLDVFAQEPPPADHPLLRQPRLICTPHLGASTEEAQVAVAVALAEQMVDFLVHQQIRNAVNAPSLSRELREALGPFLLLAERLGSLVGQLAPEHIDQLHLALAGVPLHPGRPLLLAALRGMLGHAVGEAVNDVNGPVLAAERGIRLAEERSEQSRDFTSLMTVTASGPGGEVRASGTLLGAREPRLVRLNQFELEAVPEGSILMVRNRDVPKVIGQVGLTLGEAGLNIARMALSRTADGEALSLLNLDSPVPAEVLQRLRSIPAVEEVRRLQL
jgi:(S)-sulfolactate dehydrogenase